MAAAIPAAAVELECLLPRHVIARRVEELAGAIQRDYAGCGPVTMLVVLNGALVFAADLMRSLDLPLAVDTLAAASYDGMRSTGKLVFRALPKLAVKGRSILLVDDILDSGFTLARIVEYLRNEGAAAVKSCVLLDKNTARHPRGLAQADYTAFRIPDRFVVGYGLDADEAWRHLPDVMCIRPT